MRFNDGPPRGPVPCSNASAIVEGLPAGRVARCTIAVANDLDAPADELVTGHRDMWKIERAFRSMKTALAIEPVYHRKPARILSHAHLCVLAYLLIRLAENRTHESWKLLRETLERISLSRIDMGNTVVYRTKRLTGPERNLWKRCHLAPPPGTLKIQ